MKRQGSDEELMISYRDGDKGAFDVLYRKYERPVLDFIYRSIMSVDEAENLCQETFFRVVRARQNYEATAKFKTWIFQIALNLCRDRLRRLKHRNHLSLSTPISQDHGAEELQGSIPNPSPNIEETVEKVKLNTLVQRAIASLPEREHLVVILKEYQGLKFLEISEIMDCPVGTLKSLNYRAHEKLKKILIKYIGD